MALYAKPGTPKMERLVREQTLDYPTSAFISKRNTFTETDTRMERRIDILAKPRGYAAGFNQDRRSVYWIDHFPPVAQGQKEGGGAHTISTTTTRLDELARTRSVHPQYLVPRPIVGTVRKSALEGVASERIENLSRHKQDYSGHEMERTPYMVVKPEATKAVASKRVETLALPKIRQDRFGMHESMWGQPMPVSDTAKKASIAPRVETLAEAKEYHNDFKGEKPIQWPVSDHAMKAIASIRLQQLARPRSRTMIKDDYDPFIVTIAAKKARATPRVEELCAPIPRKIRQKKAVA